MKVLQDTKCTTTYPKVLLLLGGNEYSRPDDSAGLLLKAVSRLKVKGLTIKSQSSFFKTPCFPVGAGPDYANHAVMVETDLSPQKMLEICHEVEAEFGRTREKRWGVRSLDIDLIAYGAEIMPSEEIVTHWIEKPLRQQMVETPDQLLLPHPRLQDRAFVLIPLAEIAGDWCHPILGKTIDELCQILPDDEKKQVTILNLS